MSNSLRILVYLQQADIYRFTSLCSVFGGLIYYNKTLELSRIFGESFLRVNSKFPSFLLIISWYNIFRLLFHSMETFPLKLVVSLVCNLNHIPVHDFQQVEKQVLTVITM